MTSRVALVAAWCFALILCGCATTDFDSDVARAAIESNPMKLEGEQVTLNDSQIQCGVQSELWDAPTTLSPDHTTAHLTAKGRGLKFDDEVIVRDPASKVPYVQIRGTFPIAVDSIVSTKNGEDANSKLVEAKVGVRIDDACFPGALPLMGVRHGNFSPDTPVIFHEHFDNTGWHADKVVH